MKVLVLDSGHGGSDSGATAIDGKPEKHYALALGLAVRDALAAYDCRVILTRDSDVDVSLSERAMVANRAKADLFLSLHHDSASNPAARGGSLYVHTDLRTASGGLRWLNAIDGDGTVNHRAPKSYSIAKVFMDPVRLTLNERYGIPWRGDVMCADFGVLRYCDGPALLLESHFGSNEHDCWASRQPTYIADLALAIAQGLATALQLPLSAHGTPLLGKPLATVAQAQEWARSRGAHQRFIDAAPLYWRMGEETGIRGDILFCQSAKETAFGRYGGVVPPEFNNFAGIKTLAGGANEDPDAHERFGTPEEGVRAHMTHMMAYTGLLPSWTPHPRYYVVKSLPWAGTIRTVEELGGKWAPNPDYGASVVRDYLTPMIATAVPVEEAAPQSIPVTVVIDGTITECNATNENGWVHANLEPFLLMLQTHGVTNKYDPSTRTLWVFSPIRFAPEGEG